MSKKLIRAAFFIFFVAFQNLSAQNLVSNPGFEKCDQCGRFGNPGVEFSFLNGTNTPVDWFGVTEGTSDIRSTFPRTGNRHGGFFSFGKFEYLGNVLSQPLEAGATYEFSMWLSADVVGGYSLDEIGVYFHTGLPHYTGVGNLGKLWSPHLATPDKEYIPAGAYRQYIFQYVACGGEDHLIIGRFSTLGPQDTLFIGKTRPGAVYPYIFVDDVQLTKLSDGPDLATAVHICPGQQEKIGLPTGLKNIHWSTGQQSDSITVDSSHRWVTVEYQVAKHCPSTKDTVAVIVDPLIRDNVELFTEDTVCLINSLVLKTDQHQYSQFEWNNGSSTDSINVTAPGVYVLTARGLCAYAEDRIVVLSAQDPGALLGIPNVITPGAQDNKSFSIYLPAEIRDSIDLAELNIYNRWGKQVFTTTGITQGWMPLADTPADTYLFSLIANIRQCGRLTTVQRKGSFTLVR
ncbi:MAG: gliding motility-associated C-terminal domain-containing protein [Saprospiraceae bacterium]